MSLLEHDIIRKRWGDEPTTQLEFEVGDNGKEYEVKAIKDNAVFTRKSKSHPPRLYYLVL